MQITIDANLISHIEPEDMDNGAVIHFKKLNNDIRTPAQAVYVSSDFTLIMNNDPETGEAVLNITQ